MPPPSPTPTNIPPDQWWDKLTPWAPPTPTRADPESSPREPSLAEDTDHALPAAQRAVLTRNYKKERKVCVKKGRDFTLDYHIIAQLPLSAAIPAEVKQHIDQLHQAQLQIYQNTRRSGRHTDSQPGTILHTSSTPRDREYDRGWVEDCCYRSYAALKPSYPLRSGATFNTLLPQPTYSWS